MSITVSHKLPGLVISQLVCLIKGMKSKSTKSQKPNYHKVQIELALFVR